MANYHGDIHLADTIDVQFCTTSATTGAPTTLAGTPVISAYIGNSVTQLTAGITLTVDLDGVTGLNNVRVVASGGNGYAAATNVSLVITTGTVGGTSAVGYCVGAFSIDCRGVNQILGTAVSAPATAGILDVNVKNIDNDAASASGTVTFPNATLASTTNITAGTITTVTTVTNQLTAAAIATGVWQDATAGDFTTASSIGKSLYTGNVVPGGTGGHFIAGTNAATTVTTSFTTTFTGNLTGSVASVTGAVGSVTGLTASDVGAIKTKTDFLPSATAGATGGVFIAGTNAATTITTALTTTFTGNLTGSVGSVTGAVGSVTGAVGSVTGAVGSVTGNVGGNVTGSVGSVVGAVGSVTGNVGGNVVGSVASVTAAVTVSVGTGAGQMALASGKVDIGKINGTTVNGAGVLGNKWGP